MNNTSEQERGHLNFARSAEAHFTFLLDLGYKEVESSPTIVLYRKGSIEVDVYHGRQSYEVGFGITRDGIRYSMSELIRATDFKFAKQYRYPTATAQETLDEGLTKLAELVKRYCMSAFQDDPEFFALLRSQVESWADKYAFDVMAEQLKPKANEAFRQGKYREAAELYRRIESSLSSAEIKKLIISEARSKQ